MTGRKFDNVSEEHMNISEATFVSWAQGPSQTETARCENAETAVRNALNADDRLKAMNISVFAQGSYCARTNVRQDSDVDICVRYNDSFFADYPKGRKREDFGHIASSLSYSEFRNMVGDALVDYFGEEGVTRGNKAFDVHANTYRIDADVVATFEHRRYTDDTPDYLSGVAFAPDSGPTIYNWPQQNYDNGVAKNADCARHYKRVIRILKRLCYKMRAEEIEEAMDIGSFLIECLVWNAPNEAFIHTSYTDDVRYVLADLWNRTRSDETCSEWGEVNELKYLFRSAQPWTRQQANNFLQAAWDYIGFQ